MGFGAERANLMQEEPVFMPQQTQQPISSHLPSQSSEQIETKSSKAKN